MSCNVIDAKKKKKSQRKNRPGRAPTLAWPCFPVLEVDISTILHGRPLSTTKPFLRRAEHCIGYVLDAPASPVVKSISSAMGGLGRRQLLPGTAQKKKKKVCVCFPPAGTQVRKHLGPDGLRAQHRRRILVCIGRTPTQEPWTLPPASANFSTHRAGAGWEVAELAGLGNGPWALTRAGSSSAAQPGRPTAGNPATFPRRAAPHHPALRRRRRPPPHCGDPAQAARPRQERGEQDPTSSVPPRSFGRALRPRAPERQPPPLRRPLVRRASPARPGPTRAFAQAGPALASVPPSSLPPSLVGTRLRPPSPTCLAPVPARPVQPCFHLPAKKERLSSAHRRGSPTAAAEVAVAAAAIPRHGAGPPHCPHPGLPPSPAPASAPLPG